MGTQPQNVILVDGMPCIQRAGRLWMSDETAREYLGYSSIGSYRNWLCTHPVTRIRHGYYMITPKEELDRYSGSLEMIGD
jgi:hypothetical protein